jgi:hypothetical protein
MEKHAIPQFPPSGWIWNSGEETNKGSPKILYFRKVLSFDKKPEKAVVQLSADSRYRFYVNGWSVAFGPCKGDNQVWYYDEVDLAPHLQTGENVLAAVVLRYSPLQQGNRSIWRTATPGFHLEGSIITAGVPAPLYADESWKCREASHIKVVPEHPFLAYLYHLEHTEGNAALQGWLLPGFDDSSWEKPKAYHYMQIARITSPGNLFPRPIPFLYETERRFKNVFCIRQSMYGKETWDEFVSGSSLEIPPNSVEIIEIDAGELTTGFLRFAFANGAGSKIEILTSECYAYEPEKDSFTRTPRKGNRADWENGTLHGFTDTYTVAGYGGDGSPEEYEPFWFRTFRFVRLHITTGTEPLTLREFHYRETGYPLEAKTTVKTSDPELCAIWDISLRTLRRCMHETYEDCPFYEQGQYAKDSLLQILFTYSVSADDRLARRCIDDFHRSLRYDGLISCLDFPSSIGSGVIPNFSLYYIMMIYDHMMYFGDRALVEYYMPTVDAILAFFERAREERGLVGLAGGNGPASHRFWSYLDWAPEWKSGVPDAFRYGPLTLESLVYAYTLDKAAELAAYAGRNERAQVYRQRAESIKTAVNKYCLGKNGLYQDGPGVDTYSQHCQVFAVLSDTAAAESRVPLMEQVLRANNMAKCSVSMAFYLFRALEKTGMYDKSRALWEPWEKMLENNLTTCEEDQVSTRSDCHAWGSVALYELPSAVLGVKPAKPGYGAITVKPNTGYLQWARGSMITPKGTVQVAWEKKAEGIKLDVKAPEGVEIIT